MLPKPHIIDVTDSHHDKPNKVLLYNTHDPENISYSESDNCVDDLETQDALKSWDAIEVHEPNNISGPNTQGVNLESDLSSYFSEEINKNRKSTNKTVEPKTSSTTKGYHMMTRLKAKNMSTPHITLVGIAKPTTVDQALKVP